VKLLQPQRELIWQYMRLRPTPWILLSNTGALTESHSSFSAADFPDLKQASEKAQTSSSQSTSSHWHYLNHIRHFQHNQPARPLVELFGAGYQDYLQNPLQPLADNLESITYEVFEKDPIKYEWYERAITAALQDWTTSKKAGSGPDGRIVCAVTGAGRGPLVTRALEASKKTGIEIDMWAVEKNPNAYVLLQRHNATTWQGRVRLVQSDMRTWTGPQEKSSSTSYKIDILISELLGSLADNELSPECIDGVQHLLNSNHGISIPSSYTAHISPIAAPKIHADILARSAAGDTEAFSVPYVTMLHAIDFLSARPPLAQPRAGLEMAGVRSGCGGGMPDIPLQPVIREAWEFKHPIPTSNLLPPAERNPTASGNEHNTRSTRLEFACRNRGVCHGLAGYFETVLYDPASVLGVDDTLPGSGSSSGKPKVELSTNPLTMDLKSRDMISWFPMFLPLKQPLYFPDECVLVVHMWRRTEGRSVWYEWCVESFRVERSKGGKPRRVRLGASEVVSSKASACLM
jgi:protein arginine N-methyltransferase 5